mmetsp:Transcript_106774/g.331679  ORF Transcript_106774/g.331679 Transcript_106774/m.331679 type:complete len:371 (-) Transcript_106774:388-1500(-)
MSGQWGANKLSRDPAPAKERGQARAVPSAAAQCGRARGGQSWPPAAEEPVAVARRLLHSGQGVLQADPGGPWCLLAGLRHRLPAGPRLALACLLPQGAEVLGRGDAGGCNVHGREAPQVLQQLLEPQVAGAPHLTPQSHGAIPGHQGRGLLRARVPAAALHGAHARPHPVHEHVLRHMRRRRARAAALAAAEGEPQDAEEDPVLGEVVPHLLQAAAAAAVQLETCGVQEGPVELPGLEADLAEGMLRRGPAAELWSLLRPPGHLPGAQHRTLVVPLQRQQRVVSEVVRGEERQQAPAEVLRRQLLGLRDLQRSVGLAQGGQDLGAPCVEPRALQRGHVLRVYVDGDQLRAHEGAAAHLEAVQCPANAGAL